MCFSDDARLVAAVAQDWQVGIWDLSRDLLIHVFNFPPAAVTADNAGLAFSLGGSKFAFMAGKNAVLLRVASDELIGKWPIPPGRVAELAFDPSGRLYASHFESADVAAGTLSPPTTVRIRELLPGGGIAQLLELPEFNLDVRGATWAPDASFILIAGSQVEAGLTNRFLRAVSLRGKTNLWSLPQRMKLGAPAGFELDAAAGLIAFVPGPYEVGMNCYLLEADTGNRVRRLPFLPSALSSASSNLVRYEASGAWSLHSFADGSLRTLVPPGDTKPALLPVFSRDGRFLAWDNQDGTVSVCDLPEMQYRISKLKLGW